MHFDLHSIIYYFVMSLSTFSQRKTFNALWNHSMPPSPPPPPSSEPSPAIRTETFHRNLASFANMEKCVFVLKKRMFFLPKSKKLFISKWFRGAKITYQHAILYIYIEPSLLFLDSRHSVNNPLIFNSKVHFDFGVELFFQFLQFKQTKKINCEHTAQCKMNDLIIFRVYLRVLIIW